VARRIVDIERYAITLMGFKVCCNRWVAIGPVARHDHGMAATQRGLYVAVVQRDTLVDEARDAPCCRHVHEDRRSDSAEAREFFRGIGDRPGDKRRPARPGRRNEWQEPKFYVLILRENGEGFTASPT
jgi:hypothetical protein